MSVAAKRHLGCANKAQRSVRTSGFVAADTGAALSSPSAQTNAQHRAGNAAAML
jgi:hypothetical protein